VPFFEQIAVEYPAGSIQEVEFHDGSKITLKKLEQDYDPSNKQLAIETIQRAGREQQFLTGLLYIDEKKPDFTTIMDLTPTPLAHLSSEKLRPGKKALEEIMTSLM
jgi:2-oxoglutarate/2-oxoacid ferredoxin oxidoreductase subunit beta